MNHIVGTRTSDRTWRHHVEQAIADIFPQLVELRRHLHAHPEPSGEEYQTTRHLFEWLTRHGIDSRMVLEGHGILLDVGPEQQDRFAIRADTDGLRIHDDKDVAYRSRRENVMHACGHDVHAAILVGAAQILYNLSASEKLPWSVPLRGIIQPAEETCSGAREIIEARALDQVKVVLALHVDPTRETGHIGLRPGVMTASCDELIITIHGQGGHAARPHHTRDPITAASQFINAVHVQLPRGTDSLDTVVVGFGRISGGEMCNVIPNSVELLGTLRTLTKSTRTSALTQLRDIAHGMGQLTQTQIEMRLGESAPAVENDPEMTAHVHRVATDVLGRDAVEVLPQPSMGSEDFAYFLEHVPGVMFRLGTCAPGKEMTPLHTSTFDVDEAAIAVGVKTIVHTAIEWFDPARRS